MLRVIGQRLLWMVPLVVVVTLLSFVLASMTPGSVAQALLSGGSTSASPEAVAELNRELGYDRPIVIQWLSWIFGAVQGELGSSFFTGQAVTDIIGSRLPVTLSLVIPSLVIALLVGVAIGLFTAIRGGAVGQILEGLAVFLRSIPNFWLALILVTIFAVQLLWLPVSGYVAFADSPQDWARSLILPIVALSLGDIALIAIVTRAEVLVVLRGDFVKGLRANGIPARSILFKHALKNALPPVLTMASLILVSLLGGTILAEQVFGLAGLGSQMVTSTTQHDLAVIQGIVLFYTLVVVIVFLINDIALALLNPKVVAR